MNLTVGLDAVATRESLKRIGQATKIKGQPANLPRRQADSPYKDFEQLMVHEIAHQ
jgi:hypothetical protein